VSGVEPTIDIADMSVGYGGPPVLTDVTLAVRAGELVALVGANGAGKSTLLKVIVGLLRPSSGAVHVLGTDPRDAAPRLAYLPQAEELRWDYPLRVHDVVAMGRIGRKGSAGPTAEREALARVSAADLARRPIEALSGGQRQRVLLARALVSQPELLLLDEPATGVDPATEEQLMGVLREIASTGRTVLVSTHDLAGVVAHFRRVVCLNGRVVADGDVSLLRDDRVLRETYGGHRPAGPFDYADEHHA
jgi:ABC-type Mn2+/Zn2+ transport system ATPase subunit